MCAVHDGKGERRVLLAPNYAREVRECGGIPCEPARRAAAARDDAETDGSIGRTGSGISKFGGNGLGLQRIGDVANRDGRFIRLLISDEARVRRPPVTFTAGHLFLRHKFGRAVGERGVSAAGEDSRGQRHLVEFDDVKFAGRDCRDGGAIGRKTRVYPVFTGQGGDFEISAADDVELTRKSNEKAGAVVR